MRAPAAAAPPVEAELDPTDWEAFRALGHRMVDDIAAHLAGLRDRPVWRPVPEATRRRLAEPVPVEPSDPEAVYALFDEHVRPYPMGNAHPRFWGWVLGSGLPIGVLADLLASGMNASVPGYDQAPAIVERTTIGWLAELLGLPAGASGLFVSGGSMANLVGITAARSARAGFDVRAEGVRAGPPLALYGSAATHSSVRKAVELLGLGDRAWRRIPTDAEHRIDLVALRAAIARDRAAAARPFCVVGNAGTIDVGAIDDLEALADLCTEEGLWLHVDGAFGALAAWSDALRPRVAGLERADSIAFDLHKWGFLPYDVGCALVRDRELHRTAFDVTPSYLEPLPRGIASERLEFHELGVQLSRGFRALKVWLALKTHGVTAIARVFERNVEQAAHLGERIEADPRLELVAPVALNVVAFRWVGRGGDPDRLDAVNREILLRIQESGLALPSNSTVDGRFVLRVAITNHRTRLEDLDLLFDALVEHGEDLTD